MPAPALAGGKRIFQDAPGEWNDEAVLLGDRDEHVWQDRSMRRMMPACERLEANHLAVQQRNLWLEGGDNVVSVERRRELIGRRPGGMHPVRALPMRQRTCQQGAKRRRPNRLGKRAGYA